MSALAEAIMNREEEYYEVSVIEPEATRTIVVAKSVFDRTITARSDRMKKTISVKIDGRLYSAGIVLGAMVLESLPEITALPEMKCNNNEPGCEQACYCDLSRFPTYLATLYYFDAFCIDAPNPIVNRIKVIIRGALMRLRNVIKQFSTVSGCTKKYEGPSTLVQNLGIADICPMLLPKSRGIVYENFYTGSLVVSYPFDRNADNAEAKNYLAVVVFGLFQNIMKTRCPQFMKIDGMGPECAAVITGLGEESDFSMDSRAGGVANLAEVLCGNYGDLIDVEMGRLLSKKYI